MRRRPIQELPPGYAPPAAIATSKTLALQLVTPMYGGGFKTRKAAPPWEPVRVASIRGHLRLWWRARNAARPDLRAAEAELWGAAADDKKGTGPSPVRVSVHDVANYETDDSQVRLTDEDGYVLWPANANNQQPEPVARVRPGLTFKLTISWRPQDEGAVKAALRDWLLFGGIGGRTRRGCGSIAVVDAEARQWLGFPANAAALGALLGADAAPAHFIPTLAGAHARASGPTPNALSAWRQAQRWLRTFRQGNGTQLDPNANNGVRTSGSHARSLPAVQGRGSEIRAGQSRWPEADKLRHLAGGKTAHPPHYNADPAWPRAGFGLPIQVQFQQKDRQNNFYRPPDPDRSAIGWAEAPGQSIQQRLPSALVLKPMQLENGQFVALALWLRRRLPATAVAGVVHGKHLRLGSEAPFDKLVGAGETSLFNPLVGHASLRQAFMTWLSAQGAPTEVNP